MRLNNQTLVLTTAQNTDKNNREERKPMTQAQRNNKKGEKSDSSEFPSPSATVLEMRDINSKKKKKDISTKLLKKRAL